MNKIVKILLPLAMVTVLMSSYSAQAAYGVVVGNTFTYDVVESNWDVTIDTSSSSGTGFNFLDVKRAVGTQFTVEVLTVDPLEVDWEMAVGTDTDTGTNSIWDAIGIAFNLILPALLTMMAYPGYFNQTEADLGITIFELFFVDTETVSEIFYDLAETDMEANMTEEEPGLDIDRIGGTFDNSSSTAVFEWHFDMTYVNASLDVDYSGTYVWQYAFDKTAGTMKGYYINIDYAGVAGGIDFTYKMEQKVEEVGYNLPNANGIPGFEWFVAIPIIALLGGLTIIRRKRK